MSFTSKKTVFFTNHASIDFDSARRRLLSSNDMSDKEKALLKKVSLQVHPNDEMYIPVPTGAQHYLSVGLSAVHCIEKAIGKSSGNKIVRSILDFPVGYGRVLRFLKIRFPEANITACDIDPEKLNFCKFAFSVKTVMSDKDFNKLPLFGKFDLIWCGSLITHIDEMASTNLLKLFYDHLSLDGLCVFTTHGQRSVELIQEKRAPYGLSTTAQRELLSQFREKGYGFANFENHRGYGISIVSHERMMAIARGVARWNATFYLECGWDNHHDVYGFPNAKADLAADV